MHTPAIIVALASIAIALWIRRFTWRNSHEIALTLSVALQGAALLCLLPATSETVGKVLHSWTGMWNLEDYLGHDLYVVAASSVVYHALWLLSSDDEIRADFKKYVEYPATLSMPIMLFLFTAGAGDDKYEADFFDATGTFLTAYWAVMCGTIIYLLGYAVRALVVIARDPEYRAIAIIYAVAAWCGINCCLARVISSAVPELKTDDNLAVWIWAALCGAGFALGAAGSWLIKLRAPAVDRVPA